jgi:cytosine/adenosine deaminase-related metal-dependent hydrolase
VCLCPRSNLHIGGRLPDVPALLESGVRLCLGTDSLASSPTLDVLDEVQVLREAFPAVGDERWLRMATEGGAEALGRADLGRFRIGDRSGAVVVTFGEDRA